MRIIALLLCLGLCGCSISIPETPKERILIIGKRQFLFHEDIESRWLEAIVLEKKGEMWKIRLGGVNHWINSEDTIWRKI